MQHSTLWGRHFVVCDGCQLDTAHHTNDDDRAIRKCSRLEITLCNDDDSATDDGSATASAATTTTTTAAAASRQMLCVFPKHYATLPISTKTQTHKKR